MPAEPGDGAVWDATAGAAAPSASTAALPDKSSGHTGRSRSADQTSSIATWRTGWTPRSFTAAARLSRLRSVPSCPDFGYATHASASRRPAAMAGSAPASSPARSRTNTSTASAASGAGAVVHSSGSSTPTPSGTSTSATDIPGLIWSLAATMPPETSSGGDEFARRGQRAQRAQRAVFHLANLVRLDAERAGGLGRRVGRLVSEPIAELEHAALDRAEQPERGGDALA